MLFYSFCIFHVIKFCIFRGWGGGGVVGGGGVGGGVVV